MAPNALIRELHERLARFHAELRYRSDPWAHSAPSPRVEASNEWLEGAIAQIESVLAYLQ